MDTTRRFLFGALLVFGIPIAVIIVIPIAIFVAVMLHALIACKLGLAVLESAASLALRPIRERWLWRAATLAVPPRG